MARNVLFNKCHYDSSYITTDKMFIVWFCKTLQNWKALVSGTDVSEYIEVTYDGDKHRAYVDVYAKKTNYCAEDDYNAQVASSLTPEMVQLKQVEKWDGKLPTYSGITNGMFSFK